MSCDNTGGVIDKPDSRRRNAKWDAGSSLGIIEQVDGLGVQGGSALLLFGAGGELLVVFQLLRVTQQWRRRQSILLCRSTQELSVRTDFIDVTDQHTLAGKSSHTMQDCGHALTPQT